MGSDDADDQPQEQGILGPDELDITAHPKVESIDEGRYVVSADGPDVDPDEQLEDPGFDDDAAELPSGQSASSPAEPQSTQEPPTAEQSSSTQPTTESGDEDDEEPEESATSTEEEAESKEKTPPSGSGGGSETQSPPPTTDESEESAEPPAVELTQQTVSQFLAESLAKTEEAYGFDATVNIEGDVKRGRMSSDDIAETLEGLLRWYAKQTTDEVEPEAALGIILAGSSLEVEYPVQSVYAMLKQYGLQPDDSISELLTAVRKEGSFTIPPSKNK